MNNGELFHQNVIYIELYSRGRGIVWQHCCVPSDESPSDESPSEESPFDFLDVWPFSSDESSSDESPSFHEETQRLIFSVLHCTWRGPRCEKSPTKFAQHQRNVRPIGITLSIAL